MNTTVARAAQMLGKVTIVIALLLLIWTLADIAGDNSTFPEGLGPNRYLNAFANSASVAVWGMMSIALGMVLERVESE